VYDAASQRNRLMTFRIHHVPSKSREPISRWHGVISQKNWVSNDTVTKISKYSYGSSGLPN